MICGYCQQSIRKTVVAAGAPFFTMHVHCWFSWKDVEERRVTISETVDVELREIAGHLCNLEEDYPSTVSAIRHCLVRLRVALDTAATTAAADPWALDRELGALLQTTRAALADIATATDMSLAQVRQKAGRIYRYTDPAKK